MLNLLIKQSPTVPLVHLQMQHLSIYLVCDMQQSGNLTLFTLLWIRAEFDPQPFGNGQIAVLERDPVMLHESFTLSSLLPFFLPVLTFAARPAVMLKTAQSALWFSHGDLRREATYASCFSSFCSAWPGEPSLAWGSGGSERTSQVHKSTNDQYLCAIKKSGPAFQCYAL